MVKHTQTIRRQKPANCLSVFDHFMKLALKGLAIRVFSLSFSMQNPQFLLLVSLKYPLNGAKIRKGLLLQNKKICQERKLCYRRKNIYSK